MWSVECDEQVTYGEGVGNWNTSPPGLWRGTLVE